MGRVLVCGSRNWRDPDAIEERINRLPQGTIVIHGGAPGADQMAGSAAGSRGLHSAVVRPLWRVGDRGALVNGRAGFERNAAMLDLEPELVIAFQRGHSAGTQDTIEEAERRGIPVERHAAP